MVKDHLASKKLSGIKFAVRDWCLDSFCDIWYFSEVRNRDDQLAFTQMIKMIKMQHNMVLTGFGRATVEN
uniref:Uncharacterized protein n=1 Tax=Aegilops tauschii TaxID=37682 RepID=M8BFW0_AEGTA